MYKDCVQTAKEIRAALKVEFPFTKFSVTSSRYAGGSSVSVHWDNMPTSKQVKAITDSYARVSYCSVTGEILSGGNMFVSAQSDISKEFRAEVENKMSEFAIQDNHFHYMNEWEEIVNRKYAKFVATQQPTKKETKQATKEQPKTETVTTSENVTYTINDKLNGIEITFPTKPSQTIIDSLKSIGFRWSPRGFWWAKNNVERLSFAQSLCNVVTVSNEPITVNEVVTVETAPIFTDETEYQADSIIEISANVIINNGLQPHKQPLTASEFTLYTNTLAAELTAHNTVITPEIVQYIANNPALSILSEALETIQQPSITTNEIDITPITAAEQSHSEFTVNNSPVWTITASQYQNHKKIKQPYICEISPFQMGKMSQRQKDSYFKQRQIEWNASDNCKQEYRGLIIKAFNNGLISLNTPDIHSEVKTIISSELTQRNKQQQERIKTDLIQSNKITNNSQVIIGQRVYNPLYGYGIAEKVNNKTVIMRLNSGHKMKVPVFSLQLQSNNDLLGKTMP